MPNWTTMSLSELRAATKAEIITDVTSWLTAHTKAGIIGLLMDASEFANTPTTTYGEYGLLSHTQVIRDALGNLLRTEMMNWTYYPTGEVDEITSIVTNAAGDVVDDSVIQHHIGPQPEGRFVLTVVLAPQDVSGIPAPIPGEYWKLTNVGEHASLWAVDAPPSVLLNLHGVLWAMNPAGTFGVLAVASARSDVFLPAAVRHHTGMTGAEALARRDRIADYLDGLDCDTAALRAALDEQQQMEGIVAALDHTMAQLWAAMRR